MIYDATGATFLDVAQVTAAKFWRFLECPIHAATREKKKKKKINFTDP